jgi:hypothetical protein
MCYLSIITIPTKETMDSIDMVNKEDNFKAKQNETPIEDLNH